MKIKLLTLALAITMGGVANTANAVVIDFAAMANGSTGESAWTTLSVTNPDFNLSVTGTNYGKAAYAYLDRATGGLGVCKSLSNPSTANKTTNSGTNLCSDGSDDNVTFGEALHFVFSTDVIIDMITFNNFHDSDYSLLGNKVDINGTPYTFTNGGYKLVSYTTSPFFVAAGTSFDIAFNNDQFYVHKLNVHAAVPEPATLALLGLGLLGIGVIKRRK